MNHTEGNEAPQYDPIDRLPDYGPPQYGPSPQWPPQGPPLVPPYPGMQNGLGTASLVLGIISVTLCWPAGLVGLGLGLGNLSRLRDGRANNRAQTWWGISLSILSLVILVIAVIVVVAFAAHNANNGTLQ